MNNMKLSTKFNLITMIVVFIIVYSLFSHVIVLKTTINSYSEIFTERLFADEDHLMKDQTATLESILKEMYSTVETGELKHEQVVTLTKHILKSTKYNNGKSAFWLVQTDGTSLFNYYIPDNFGKNVLDSTDANGLKYIQEAINICKKDGEGFYNVVFNNDGKLIEKKVYVKLIKDLDIIIVS